MTGASNISMKTISKMDAPELSVLAYAMKQRNKNKENLFSSRLGGKQ